MQLIPKWRRPTRSIVLGLATCCCVLLQSPARSGDLRIRVSDVSLTTYATSPTFGATLTYTISGNGLNVLGALQSVDIAFVSQGAVVKTISRLPGDAGAVPGINTVPLYGPDLPAPGTYTVRVTVNGVELSATDYVEVSSPADPNLQFTNANGIDVNRVPGAVHHGLIYVAEGAAGTVGGRTTREGVYVLNPDLTPALPAPRATNADIGSLGPWGDSANSPFRVTVGQDSMVYITDVSDSHSGLFVASPDLTSVQPLFAYPTPPGGSRAASGLVKTAGGENLYGSISSVLVDTSGATRKVWTTEEDLNPADSLWQRPVPAGQTSAAVLPELAVNLTGSAWVQDFVRDTLGNFYVVSTAKDDARKFGAAGSLLATLPPNSTGYYGISLDEPRNLLFLCTSDGRVFRTDQTFAESEAIIEGLGAPVRDVATDSDAWIYALDGGNRRLRAFAAPGDYTVLGDTAAAPMPLVVILDPPPGDIAPVGPGGLYTGPNGLCYGDGKVDLLDSAYILRLAMGLAPAP